MRAQRDEYKQAADALARALNMLIVEQDPADVDLDWDLLPIDARPHHSHARFSSSAGADALPPSRRGCWSDE
jgi:hypothetical protein